MGVSRHRPARVFFCRLLALALLSGNPSGRSAAQERASAAPPSRTEIGTETCLICHEAEEYRPRHPFRMKGRARVRVECENCHGPGSAHAESGDPSFIDRFPGAETAEGALAPAAAAAVCLKCHASTAGGFTFSVHYRGDRSCTACHAIHRLDRRSVGLAEGEPEPRRLLKFKEGDFCLGCHLELQRSAGAMAALRQPHGHDAGLRDETSLSGRREGYVTCAECHLFHNDGPGDARRKHAARCQNPACHPALIEPFVGRHEATRAAGCLTCHDPHGSPYRDALLFSTERLPLFFCVRCHIPRHGTQREQGRCVSCHAHTHGSDSDLRFFTP